MILLIVIAVVCGSLPQANANDRPIIGVLTQEISRVFELMFPGRYDCFIPASYVKWVESGGARVVPIFVGNDAQYYRDIMYRINGVLLPGGNVDRNNNGGYAEAAEHIIRTALEFNTKKDIFPVFGIGLGMDMLLSVTNGVADVTSDCHLDSIAVSLILSKKGKI